MIFCWKYHDRLSMLIRYPGAFPTHWAFDWRSNLNIDRVMAIWKFELLFDLVTSSMTSWVHDTYVAQLHIHPDKIVKNTQATQTNTQMKGNLVCKTKFFPSISDPSVDCILFMKLVHFCESHDYSRTYWKLHYEVITDANITKKNVFSIIHVIFISDVKWICWLIWIFSKWLTFSRHNKILTGGSIKS